MLKERYEISGIFLKTLIMALLICLVQPGLTNGATAPAPLADYRIADAVLKNLEIDPRVPSHLIDVAVSDGVVTLSGSVDDLLARDRAIDVAESTKGVISVVDRIEISPTRISDKKLTDYVQKALINSSAVESYEIDAQVRSGVAILKGTVDSPAERKLAIEKVKGVKGLRNLISEIKVVESGIRKDFKLREEIRRKLSIDPILNPKPIDVDVEEARVSLSGSVGSAAEKTRAVQKAWVVGVKSVDASDLMIRWWEEDTLIPQTEKLGPTEIAAAVEEALEADPRVFSQKLKISVNNGVVTLSGSVGNLSAKAAAERTALHTVGVRRVINLLKIKPKAQIPDDAQLARRLRQAYERDAYVDPDKIDIYVSDGRIYLSGQVDSGYEKVRAKEIAEDTKGALKVDNNLEFRKGWDFKDDLELKEDVEFQIFWSPFVDGDRINVEVDHGTVILTGRVSSWQAYRYARLNALDAGAKDVRNRLIVEDQRIGTWF